MSYYRPDDDPYMRPRSPRYDYRGGEPPSRSPDYTRGAAPGPVYGRGGRSPSPYSSYDRHRSPRSPRYRAGPPVDRDPYDRYDRDRYERDRYDREADYRDSSYAGSTYRESSAYRNPYAESDYAGRDRGDRERDRDRFNRRPPAAAPAAVDQGPIPDPLESPALLPFKQFAHVHRQRQARLDPTSSSSDLSTQEMFNLYKSYKVVYTARSARRFWEEKRDLPFFYEKYGLGDVEVERRHSRRRQGRHGRKQKWLEELTSGKIDGVNFEQHFPSAGAPPHESTIFSRSGEPIKLTSDALPIDPCPEQLLVMRIPPECSRATIEEALGALPGFRYLALGEAHANKAYFAIGWAQFETEQQAADARTKMPDTAVVRQNKLQLDLALRGVQVKFRSAPSGAGRLQRLATDLRQAKELVRWLEAEDREQLWPTGEEAPALDDEGRRAIALDASSEIESRVQACGAARYYDAETESQDDALRTIGRNERPFESEQARTSVREAIRQELDMHLDLLREVYHCDYYSSTICDFAEELVRRARAHYRRVYPPGESEAEREGRDRDAGGGAGGGEDSLNVGEEQWAENLDRKHALLLNLPSSDIEDYGGVDLDKLMLSLATPFTRQDAEEKHRCIVEVVNPAAEKAAAATGGGDTSMNVGASGAVAPAALPATKTCDKLFRALVFVQKHVCNKHRDIIERELGEGRKQDILYLNNYIRDPTRVMPPLSGSLVAAVNERERRAAGHHQTHSWDDPAGLSAGEGARMGLIRMGSSSFGGPSGPPGVGGEDPRRRGGAGIGKRRRSNSPVLSRRDSKRGAGSGLGLSERLGAGPPPIHLGGGPPLHLRLGGLAENGGSSSSNGFADGGDGASAVAAEPLPPAPRPLDPRAARGKDVRSYQDLDTAGEAGAGGDGAGEVMELEY